MRSVSSFCDSDKGEDPEKTKGRGVVPDSKVKNGRMRA